MHLPPIQKKPHQNLKTTTENSLEISVSYKPSTTMSPKSSNKTFLIHETGGTKGNTERKKFIVSNKKLDGKNSLILKNPRDTNRKEKETQS